MEEDQFLNCPVDNTPIKLDKKMVCGHCGEDLASLGRLDELPLAYYNEGLRLAREGQWEEALQKLAAAAELKKGFARPLLVMGKIYAQKGLLPEAIHYWERFLEVEPDNQAAQQGIAKAQELMAAAMEEAPAAAPVAIPSRWPQLAAGVSGLVVLLLLGVTAFLWHGAHQVQLQLSAVKTDLNTEVEGRRHQVQGLEAIIAALRSGEKPGPIPDRSAQLGGAEKPPASEALTQEDYVVQKGDTLRGLCQRYLAAEHRWPELYGLNHDLLAPNPDRLPVGQKIKIIKRAK